MPLTIGPRPLYIVNVACAARFSDVCPDYWAYTYIEYLAAHGIISGYADGTFRPGATATRAQLAKMIVLARGWPIVTPPSPSFRDVPAERPLLWLHRDGEGARRHLRLQLRHRLHQFRPNNKVTRGQISKMIVAGLRLGRSTPPAARTSPTCRRAIRSTATSRRPSTATSSPATARPSAPATPSPAPS